MFYLCSTYERVFSLQITLIVNFKLLCTTVCLPELASNYTELLSAASRPIVPSEATSAACFQSN